MPLKLLLVDDEKEFLAALTRRLSVRKIKASTALSGPEALRKLEEEPDTDVVVLDVKMPNMDGLETLKEIKRMHPITEVILLTGHGTFESAVEGMKLGAFDYLMKPCDLAELLAKILEAKNKKRRHQEKVLAKKPARAYAGS